MHLDLGFPSAWVRKEAPGSRFVAVLPGATPDALPQAIVTYGPIELRPDEPKAWQEEVAASDTPRGARVRIGRTLDRQSSTGWPLRLIEVELARISDNSIVEVRLCAFFTFFEHTAVVIARAGDRAALDAVTPTLLSLLATGVPNWTGATTPLAGLWDLPSRVVTEPMRVQPDLAALSAELEEIDQALAETVTVEGQVRRGRTLLLLKRPEEALTAFAAALALDDRHEAAHYFRGVAHGDLGQHGAAVEAWERAAQLVPRADTYYNIGQARFFQKQPEAALAAFQRVLELEPHDFLTGRKIVQCLYALGRFEEGQAARMKVRSQWETTRDPRARFVSEYVFDQFDADGFSVHAIEVLKPAKPSIYTLLVFQAVALHGHHDHPLPASVHVETSDEAQAAGTPFVVGLRTGDRFKVIGVSASLPPYPDTKREVVRVLREALTATTH